MAKRDWKSVEAWRDGGSRFSGGVDRVIGEVRRETSCCRAVKVAFGDGVDQ